MGPLIFLWCADAAWVTLLDPGSPPPLLKHDFILSLPCILTNAHVLSIDQGMHITK